MNEWRLVPKMTYSPVSKRRASKGLLTVTIVMLFGFLLSACNGNPQTQQQAQQNKASLDSLVTQAQSIGVPVAMLQPILHQEQLLSGTSAPFSVLSDQPINDYYSNLVQRYQTLKLQVQGVEYQATQELDYQASLDLQGFENALAQRESQNFIEAKTFAAQFTQDQKMLAKAQYPKDYIQISTLAKGSTQALHLMGPTYDALTSLQHLISVMQASHLDVTALNQQAQDDLQLFRNASGPDNFTYLMDQINTQLQETAVFSSQAIPYIGATKLQELSTDISLLQKYGGQGVTTFQQHFNADQAALAKAKFINDYLKVSSQVDKDTASIQLPLAQSQASYLLKQFHQEVTNWGKAHQYHDPNDGHSYNLDYEYDQQGIGSDADAAMQSAQSIDDYQSVIDLVTNDMFHLKAMEADYGDRTPWNQTHGTDLSLMKHYNVTNAGQVFIVSLVEQTLRLYEGGKLVRSFLITSGQYDKPSPPGLWQIFVRESPTIFKSSEPKGSAFWYPDTNINFAMEYHEGGYFFHDSWWRADYGPGTNFPHYDSGGDKSFAGNGSHGCFNMQENDASWLYKNTTYGASVIVY